MSIDTINLTLEEVKALLADGRVILATREELCADLDALRVKIADLESTNLTLSKLAEELDKARWERDGWRAKALDVAQHPVVVALLSDLNELRSALRQTIINMGGIAEPEVSDAFLVEGAPAEAEALKKQRDELLKSEAALREALWKLSNEVGGLSIAELEIRQAIGNTNWSVLMLRKDEAKAALTTPAPEALERVKGEAQAEVLDWLVAEAARQRAGIVLAFGQVDPSDILSIAVKKSAELRGQR